MPVMSALKERGEDLKGFKFYFTALLSFYIVYSPCE